MRSNATMLKVRINSGCYKATGFLKSFSFCTFFFIGDNIGQKEQLLKRNLHISRCKNNGRCKIGVRFIYLRYAWFSENMRKNAEEKIEKKNRKKKKWRKIKNRFKINKLFYMLLQIHFTFFFFFYVKFK